MSATTQLQMVREILDKTVQYFQSKGIKSARLDAELLLAHTLGMDRLRLYLSMDRPLNAEELTNARELVRRRAMREPIAYILGTREFCSRSFEVNPSVLIPRPETELLVEQAISELKRRFPDEGTAFRILEFGVGSGAIAVSLAAELPSAQIIATEISESAAETARKNTQKHGVEERIDIRVQPDFSGIVGPFHAIVSNPPYVRTVDASALEDDVVRFEPHEALFAGEDGLKWYRYLTAQAPALLIAGGFLLMEIGQGQAGAVQLLGVKAGLTAECVTKDYAGIERIVRFGRQQ